MPNVSIHGSRSASSLRSGLRLCCRSVAPGGSWNGLREGLPDRAAIERMGVMDQATSVFDDKDQLAFTIFKEQRIDVPLSDISPNLIHALVAVEDQRFYDHHGFDLVRIGSAAMANVRRRRAAQGGSTITQQLARQSFLTPDKTIRRKLQELILAARIESLHEAADPRAVSEQGVFRRRPVWRRSGGARLLRQARVGADVSGGGAAGRAW